MGVVLTGLCVYYSETGSMMYRAHALRCFLVSPAYKWQCMARHAPVHGPQLPNLPSTAASDVNKIHERTRALYCQMQQSRLKCAATDRLAMRTLVFTAVAVTCVSSLSQQ